MSLYPFPTILNLYNPTAAPPCKVKAVMKFTVAPRCSLSNTVGVSFSVASHPPQAPWINMFSTFFHCFCKYSMSFKYKLNNHNNSHCNKAKCVNRIIHLHIWILTLFHLSHLLYFTNIKVVIFFLFLVDIYNLIIFHRHMCANVLVFSFFTLCTQLLQFSFCIL